MFFVRSSRCSVCILLMVGPSSRYDCLGPMGKSAFDIAALLDILIPVKPLPYLSFLEETTSMSIGAAGASSIAMTDEERSLYREAIDMLGDSVKCTDIYIEGHKELHQNFTDAKTYRETQRKDWKRYLGGCEGDVKTLDDLVAWHHANPVSPSPTSPC